MPVAMVGSVGLPALDVAPVSLNAHATVPLRMLSHKNVVAFLSWFQLSMMLPCCAVFVAVVWGQVEGYFFIAGITVLGG